jgi:hypothetical protein
LSFDSFGVTSQRPFRSWTVPRWDSGERWEYLMVILIDEVFLPDLVDARIPRLLWFHKFPFRRLDLDGLDFVGFTSFR